MSTTPRVYPLPRRAVHGPRRKVLPRPTHLGLALLVALCLAGLGLGCLVGGVRAQTSEEGVPRFTSASRGPRASYGTEAVERWREMVSAYDWDADTALLVIACESQGNPGAQNPTSDARGLWQLLGWEHVAYRLHGVWSVMNPYVATDVAYRIWEWGGRRFDTAIGWHASVGCWGW